MNEQDILSSLRRIECQLSPENLTCDGELPRTEVKRRAKRLGAEKTRLEKLLGRVPSMKELFGVE